jgi:hypothetical protein
VRTNYHNWTDAEREMVRQLHATHSAEEISLKLFGHTRMVRSIYNLASRLGLRKWPKWPADVQERVRALHAGGLLDREIASRVGLGRRQVAHVRKNLLGLPVHAGRVLEIKRTLPARQALSLGIRHGGDLRRLAFRQFAVANGWPEDLRPREVQILNVLAEQGPQTMHDLAVKIGMRTDRIGGNGRPALLVGNGPGGTYTASLMRRGLIWQQTRYATGGPKGKNRLPNLYCLTPEAIAWREARGEQQRNPQETSDPRPVPGTDSGSNGNRSMGAETPGSRVQRREGKRRRSPDGRTHEEGPGR